MNLIIIRGVRLPIITTTKLLVTCYVGVRRDELLKLINAGAAKHVQ